MLINRSITEKILSIVKQYPVITITGPRQSGKTTLCQQIFPNKPYISLEDLDQRDFANNDPKGFLSQYPDGAVFDEIQKAPALTSYIQTIVDAKQKNGLYILTGSQQFEIMSNLTQSLAGRTALIKLLPFSYQEIYHNNKTINLTEVLFKGFYPRIFKENLNPTEALMFYINTYIERDLRNLINIKDLSVFEIFLKLIAGRTGQILNYSSISNDIGIDQKTVKNWLSILEASYIIKIIYPYYQKQNKRYVKAPKLFFYDTGLVCCLLNIKKPEQLNNHPLFGSIFETYVISEILKIIYNRVLMENLFFFRDHAGHEVDVIFDKVIQINAIEIKAARTINPDFFKGLDFLKTLKYKIQNRGIIYGGEESYTRNQTAIICWREIQNLITNFIN